MNTPRPARTLVPLLSICVALAALIAVPTSLGAQEIGPHIAYIYPAGGQQGTTVEITARGSKLEGVDGVRISGQGVSGKVVSVEKEEKDEKTKRLDESENPFVVRLSVTIDQDAALGQRDLRLVTPRGVSNRWRFMVGQFPEVVEEEPNSSKDEAQVIESLPAVVNGQIFQADRDFFRFKAAAGETIVCDARARKLLPYIADAVPGWLQASLVLYDADGNELAYVDDFRFHPDPVLIYKVEKDGEYLVDIKDVLYRGRDDLIYRLTIGAVPYITDAYPLGARRGGDAKVALSGVNLPSETMDVKLPADCPSRRWLEVVGQGITSNALPFAAGDVAESSEAEPNDLPEAAQPITAPIVINGRIEKPGDTDCFKISAKKDEKLVIDVAARRLQSPLDSTVALLQPQQGWTRKLVDNDDTVDESEPLITHHADSYLTYKFTADGDYVIRLRDVQGKGGQEYAYRLRVSPPLHDFSLLATPDNPTVGQGGSAAITVTALRKDEFDGEIHLAVEGLPEGFVASGATIPSGQNEARLTITAPADAKPAILSPTITGTATNGEKEVVRRAQPAEKLMQAFIYWHNLPTDEFLLAVTEAGPLALSVDLPADEVLEVKQGGQVEVKVKVKRQGETKAAVKVAAIEPPKGITVRTANVAADADEATLAITVQKQIPIGFCQNIILNGTMKSGKETLSCVAPAVPIKVIAAGD